MSKIRTVKGIIKTFLSITKEDWDKMDRKFYRILFGAISFIVMGLFWFYILRNILPF